MSLSVRTLLFCVPLLTSASSALAGSVALSPLLGDDSVTQKDRLGVHQVLSSELDFAPEIERVVTLSEVPAGLDDWCLTNARCLTGIANTLEVDGIVAGRVSRAEANLVLDLVYFDAGRLVRRQAFVVPHDPTGLANAMNAVTRELLTGENPRERVAEQVTEADFEVEDDLDIGTGSVDDFDFGSAAPEDISVATLEEPPERRPAQAEPEPRQPVAPREARAPDAPPTRTGGATERAPVTRGARERAPRPKPARTTARVERPPREDRPTVFEITARGGYSPYYSFDFVTAGGEVALRLGRHVQLVGGLEMFMVKRDLPQRLQKTEGVCCVYDSIFPFNAGLLYEFGNGPLRPYIGADAIFVQYYRDEIGGDFAGGARARAGLDYMVGRNFGLNLNVAAGAWTGQNWGLIERGVGQTGFLPQVSGGTVFAF